MNDLKIFILIILLLPACGRVSVGYDVSTEFEEHVHKFRILGQLDTPNLTMSFGELWDNYVGMCWYADYSVVIEPKYWENSSYSQRELLVFHELGHCILLKKHDNSELDDGCPNSVMNSHMFSEECYKKHYDHYIEDLFNLETA